MRFKVISFNMMRCSPCLVASAIEAKRTAVRLVCRISAKGQLKILQPVRICRTSHLDMKQV